jgi:DNA ligase-1
MLTKFDTLYHIDGNQNVRVWWMEQNGDEYRAVSGVENGQLVTSEWKKAKAKNVGRANATTAVQQATAEIESQYTKKLDRKYSRTKDTASKSNIIEPMLAATYKGWDSSWKYVYSQPKLDGMRCIATADGLFSRGGKPIVSVPHIERALKPLFDLKPDLILDGELYNHALRDDFNELISIARQMKPTQEDILKAKDNIDYHVYDVIQGLDFGDRHSFLKSIVAGINSDSIKLVPTIGVSSEEALDVVYAELLQEGYEGQMIRLDTPYEQKRTKNLLKRKEFIDDEFEVIEILEGLGNWSGYAKSVRCKTKEGVIFNAGIKGSQEFTKKLLTQKPVPKTVTVRYQNVTPDGSLRFPIAVAFYENERDA